MVRALWGQRNMRATVTAAAATATPVRALRLAASLLLLLAALFSSPLLPPLWSSSPPTGSFLLPVDALYLVRSNSSNIEAASPFFVFGVTEFALGGELIRASPVDACDRINFNASGMVVWIEPFHCSIETKIRHCAAAGCLAAVSSSAYRIPGNEMWTQWEGASGSRRGPASESDDIASLGVPFVHVGREDATLLRLALSEREATLKGATIGSGGEGARSAPGAVVGSARVGALTVPTPTPEVVLANLSASSLTSPSSSAHFHVFLSSADSSNAWQQAYTSLYFTLFFQVFLGLLNVVVALVAMAKFKRFWSIKEARPFYANIPLVCLALLIAANLERGLYCFLDPMGATHTLPRGVRRVMLSASVPWTYASTLLLTFFWSEAIHKKRNNAAQHETAVDDEKMESKPPRLHPAPLQSHLQGMSAAQIKQLQSARNAALKRLALRAGVDSPAAGRHADREYARRSRGGGGGGGGLDGGGDAWELDDHMLIDPELIDLHAHVRMPSPSPSPSSSPRAYGAGDADAHHDAIEFELVPMTSARSAMGAATLAMDLDAAGSGSEPCTPQVTQGLLSPNKRAHAQGSASPHKAAGAGSAAVAASASSSAAAAPLVRKKSGGSGSATPKTQKKHTRSSGGRRVGGAGEFDEPLKSDADGRDRHSSDVDDDADTEEDERLGSSLADTVSNIGDVVVDQTHLIASSPPSARKTVSPAHGHVHTPLRTHLRAAMPQSQHGHSSHQAAVTLRIAVPGAPKLPLPPPPPPAPPATPAPPAELCRAFLLAEQQYSARAVPGGSSFHKANQSAPIPHSSSYSGLGSVPLYMHLPATAAAPAAAGAGASKNVAHNGSGKGSDSAVASPLVRSSAVSSPRASAATGTVAAAPVAAGHRSSTQHYRFVPVVSVVSSAQHDHGRDTPLTLLNEHDRRTPVTAPSSPKCKAVASSRPSSPVGQQLFLVRYQSAFILATLFLTALDLTFSLLDALYILDWKLLPLVEIVFAVLGVAVTAAYFYVSAKVLQRLKHEGEAKLAAAQYNFAQEGWHEAAAAAGSTVEDGAAVTTGTAIAAGLAADDFNDWTARIEGLKTASQRPHLQLQHLQRPIAIVGGGGMRSAQSSPALVHLGDQAPDGVGFAQHDGDVVVGAGGRSPRGPYAYASGAAHLGSASSSPLVVGHGAQPPHAHAHLSSHAYYPYPPTPLQLHPMQLQAYPHAQQQQAPHLTAAAAASLASQRASVLAALRSSHHNKVVRMWQFLVGSGVGLLLFLAVSLTSPQLWHTRVQSALDDPLTTISRDFLLFLALFIVGACQVSAF